MWEISDSGACYFGDSGQAIGQQNIFVPGQSYLISIEVSGMTKGQLRFDSFGGDDYIRQNGTYQFYGVATIPDLSVTGLKYGSESFDGCVAFIYAIEPPLIEVIDCADAVVYQVPFDSLTLYRSNIQVVIPWDLPDGKYRVRILNQGLYDISECFQVGTHACTLLLSWTNNDNGYGIDYETLKQVNKLRVNAKNWHPRPKSDRDIFEFSDGSKRIIYAKTDIQKSLTIQELPEYLVEALGIGKDHDHFYIDSEEYIVNDDELDVAWRKSSQTAPVELSISKKTSNLINKNCK